MALAKLSKVIDVNGKRMTIGDAVDAGMVTLSYHPNASMSMDRYRANTPHGTFYSIGEVAYRHKTGKGVKGKFQNPDIDSSNLVEIMTEAFEKGIEMGQSLGSSTDDMVNVVENPRRRSRRNSIFLTPAVMAQLGQSGVGRILTSNPRKRKGRRNPDDASAELYEEFHGKPSEQLTEYVYEEHEHDSLAQLGELISVTVLTTTGYEAKIDAPSIDGSVNDVVQLCSSEDRRQLYFVGGNQAIDVEALGFGGNDIKDLMVIGVLTQVEYCTKKKFHKFKPVDYYHELGEETGQQPILLYDPISQLMKVAGGAYEVKDVGIVN